MHVLCPHCRNPIEVVGFDPREEVACPACGSTFHLEAGSATGSFREKIQRIGRFDILDTLGVGGFGTVYKARDPQLDRTVALKVPRRGSVGANQQDLDRFIREARSVAQLRHPSIVSVHEVGAENDTPYLVSDFIDGVTLSDELTARRPPLRDAAKLVADVADALHYAHQQGVVHRDVKPSNILIRPDGSPVVADFGLAKRDAGEVTMTMEGQVLGTPAYMPPEQARGEGHQVDGRSDVYSLGVVLYQLLTGELPFRGNTRMLLHQVLNDDPRTPRSLNDSIPRDLETICLKAMAKEPTRRYPNARELASDLRHWLGGEPILARPVGRIERAWRWCRRNPLAASLTAAVALLLVSGMAIATGLAVWAMRGWDQADRERNAKSRALDDERRARDTAMTALRDLSDDIVENQMARGTTLTEENKEFLRKVIKHFEGFAAITSDDAESRSIRAEGYRRVGLMRYHLGELKEAEAGYADALAIYKQLVADFPTHPDFQQQLAKSYNNLANLLRITGRLNDAEAVYEDALAIRKQLAAVFPARPEFRQDLATSQNNLGLLFNDTGRPKEAEVALNDALANQKQLAADFPTRPEFRQELARSHCNLSIVLRVSGRLKEAEAALTDALAIQKQLAADFPTRHAFRRELALCHINLGSLFHDTGRLTKAEADYLGALTIQKRLAAEFPSRPEFRQELAMCRINLGNLFKDTGRLKQAEAVYTDALAIQEQLAADFPSRPEFRQELAGSHYTLGILLSATGRSKEAEAAYTDAVTIQSQLVADFPTRFAFRRELAKTHINRGIVLRNMGRLRGAEAAYADALVIQRQLAADFPTRHEFRRELATSYNNLGIMLSATGRLKEAQAAYADALAIQKQLAADFPTRHEFRQELARSQNNLGLLFSDTGRPKEAEAAYADALSIRRQLAADFPNQPDLRSELASTLNNLAVQCIRGREFGAGRAYLAEAQPHHQAALKTNPRNLTYRQFYRTNLLAHAGAQDQIGVVRVAVWLRDLGWDPPSDAYEAACALALCIPVVQQDENAVQEERDKAMQFYGDEAMKMLKDAVSKGYKHAAQMIKNKDLDTLRKREDFQKLLAELEVKRE